MRFVTSLIVVALVVGGVSSAQAQGQSKKVAPIRLDVAPKSKSNACGDGEVEVQPHTVSADLFVTRNGMPDILTKKYSRFVDRKHNVILAVIPDPDPQRYERFFDMIIPSICLLRSMPGFYKRMQHNDGNTINKLRPIEFIATNSEVSMAVAGPNVSNGMTIGYKLYTEGYGYKMYSPYAWGSVMVGQMALRDLGRRGLNMDMNDHMEFHASLYSLHFLETVGKSKNVKNNELYTDALAFYKRQLDKMGKRPVLRGRYDSTKSALWNLCRFEKEDLKGGYGKMGFKPDPACSGDRDS
jgi:hypothetical protein